jgi:hypothetical protein
MISHEYKFILITPKKTGSTSLTSALLPYCDVKKINQESSQCFNIFDEFTTKSNKYGSKHITIQKVQRGLNKRQKDIKDFLKIGVVRNPFSRVISFWRWSGKFNNLSFSDFLKYKKPPEYFSSFVLNGEFVMDCVIKFENLQQDFNIVCDKIGVPRQELPHTNKSKHKHYTEYYDEETKQIVAERYAKDIEHFGYEFRE